MQLLSERFGWALTELNLAKTEDGGATWTAITPASTPADAIRGVFFLDPTHGWVVSSSQTGVPVSLVSLRTTDGGRTWAASTIAPPSDDHELSTGAPASVQFVDAANGWVLERLVSGSSFSVGRLYRTADGGATWTELPEPPTGGTIRFQAGSNGWLAGGPLGDKLFRTADGGQTWQPVKVSIPQAFSGIPATYTTPTFQTATDGVLPVTINADPAVVVFYVTTDAGQTWTAVSQSPTSLRAGAGASAATNVVDLRTWVTTPSNLEVSTTVDGGENWATKTHSEPPTPGVPAITALDFVSESTGWVLEQSNFCRGFKSDCTELQPLFVTKDGGQTLTQLHP